MSLEREIFYWGGQEVSAMAVYSDIFSIGDNYIQRKGEYSIGSRPKSNPLVYSKYDRHVKGKYRILLEDTFEETLKEAQEADFAIMNGITYFGRKNTQDRANTMYAMIFDLDGVTEESLGNFFSGAYRSAAYPIPNYVALSGHGVHLYYLFEYPIPLYPNLKLQLKQLKYALTEKMWNPVTSIEPKPQYQGINQGFRVIGSKTKVEGVRVRAFKMNPHPFNLENLSSFVPPESRIDESKIWKESKMTLEQASKKFPEWYAEVEKWNNEQKGKKTKKKKLRIVENKGWTTKRALYDWWLRQIKERASVRHRYFCIMALAIYAVKSGIEREELERDAYSFVPYLDGLVKNDPFTKTDCDSALECYDRKYKTFPRKDIEKITGIAIPENTKRKYNDRNYHLSLARERKQTMKKHGKLAQEGRPKKEDMVVKFIKNNPDKSVSEIAKELGVSRTTVYKYMEKE